MGNDVFRYTTTPKVLCLSPQITPLRKFALKIDRLVFLQLCLYTYTLNNQ